MTSDSLIRQWGAIIPVPQGIIKREKGVEQSLSKDVRIHAVIEPPYTPNEACSRSVVARTSRSTLTHLLSHQL